MLSNFTVDSVDLKYVSIETFFTNFIFFFLSFFFLSSFNKMSKFYDHGIWARKLQTKIDDIQTFLEEAAAASNRPRDMVYLKNMLKDLCKDVCTISYVPGWFGKADAPAPRGCTRSHSCSRKHVDDQPSMRKRASDYFQSFLPAKEMELEPLDFGFKSSKRSATRKPATRTAARTASKKARKASKKRSARKAAKSPRSRH